MVIVKNIKTLERFSVNKDSGTVKACYYLCQTCAATYPSLALASCAGEHKFFKTMSGIINLDSGDYVVEVENDQN